MPLIRARVLVLPGVYSRVRWLRGESFRLHVGFTRKNPNGEPSPKSRAARAMPRLHNFEKRAGL